MVLWQSGLSKEIQHDLKGCIVDCTDPMMQPFFSSQITNAALDEALSGHVSSPTVVEIVKSP